MSLRYRRVQRRGTILYMDELPSAEFRKRYAKLTKATLVTVNGHVIGMWSPIARFREGDHGVVAFQPADEAVAETAPHQFTTGNRPYYSTRPFTPVPKVKK